MLKANINDHKKRNFNTDLQQNDNKFQENFEKLGKGILKHNRKFIQFKQIL